MKLLRLYSSELGRLLKNLIKIFLNQTWEIWRGVAQEFTFFLGRLKRTRKITAYLNSVTPKNRALQIGTGANPIAGWLNSDLFPSQSGTIFLDASAPLPLPNESLRFIYTEHTIEHISLAAARRLLIELHRTLQVGGVVRIATPNLEKLLALFEEPKTNDQETYLAWMHENWLARQGVHEMRPAYSLNLTMRAWGHQFLYDIEVLKDLARITGFASCEPKTPQKSDFQQLCNLEKHGDFIGNRWANDYETLIIELAK